MDRESPPASPACALWLSYAVGVPVGALSVALFMALFRSSSIATSLNFLLDIFPVTMFAYIFAGLTLIVYAFPVVWIANYFKIVSPLVAFVAGLAPGVGALMLYGLNSIYAWLTFTIGLSIATIFSGILGCTRRAL